MAAPYTMSIVFFFLKIKYLIGFALTNTCTHAQTSRKNALHEEPPAGSWTQDLRHSRQAYYELTTGPGIILPIRYSPV